MPYYILKINFDQCVLSRAVEEEANSVKLQEEMMYQGSEHAVAIETLKADYENVMEQTTSEIKRKHQGEITLGKRA